MIGIIGGTGLYKLDGLSNLQQKVIETPFGVPSAPLMTGELLGKTIAFLPRHGSAHELLPSEINYRANIFALKSVGVTEILSVSAVGSLAEELAPGSLVLPTQYLDLTKGIRAASFFGDGLIGHISSAKPVCNNLVTTTLDAGKESDVEIASGATYACVEGPRLGTAAESHMLRGLEAKLVGMTNVPEVFLAREAQMCYASICVVTDYDSWRDDPSEHATVDAILARYQNSLCKVKSVIDKLVANLDVSTGCSCRTNLASALLTPRDSFKPHHHAIVSILER